MEEQRDAAVHHTNALRILGKLLDKGTVDRLSLQMHTHADARPGTQDPCTQHISCTAEVIKQASKEFIITAAQHARCRAQGLAPLCTPFTIYTTAWAECMPQSVARVLRWKALPSHHITIHNVV